MTTSSPFADESRDTGHDEMVLQRALAEFERSNKSTKKGSNLDRIAHLAVNGNPLAVRELMRIVLEMRIAEYPARSVLLDPADVDDAIQATLIIVATKIGSFKGDSSFKTWAETIAKNEALLIVRRKQRKTEPETNEIPEQDRFAQHLSSLVAGEDIWNQSVSSLSHEHQEVLRLREDLALPYEEIAKRLGVPVGTVRSRISRARMLLAERLVSVDPDRRPNGET